MKKKNVVVPKPDKMEQRICFGISWFKSLDAAMAYHRYVVEQGYTYNGGWYHGMPCGRDSNFDYFDKELGQLFAVTD